MTGATAEIRLNDVKNDLRKIGCKLKSQLDGSWAIHGAKGAKVIVPSLAAVREYYLVQVGQLPAVLDEQKPDSPASQPHAVDVVESDIQAAPVLQSVVPAVAPAVVPSRPAPSPMTEEQQKAIAAVNTMFRDLHAKRLRLGGNVLQSEIAGLLARGGCPEAMLAKAKGAAEAKLKKDCNDNKLVKIVFENAAGRQDVMYFDSHYASLLKL